LNANQKHQPDAQRSAPSFQHQRQVVRYPVVKESSDGPEQVQGKSISQVNFRIGANNDPKATGFSYRISVQGCN
jgi:hypothetical protein